jgi:hypothetical protein
VKSIEPSDSARGYRIYVTDESQLMLWIHCDTLPFGFEKTTPSKRRIVHEDPALRETLNKPVMGKLVFIKEEALLWYYHNNAYSFTKKCSFCSSFIKSHRK